MCQYACGLARQTSAPTAAILRPALAAGLGSESSLSERQHRPMDGAFILVVVGNMRNRGSPPADWRGKHRRRRRRFCVPRLRGTWFRILPVRKAAPSDGRCFYFGCGGKHEKPWQSACGLARQTSAPTAAILCSAPARDLVQNPPAPARKQEKLKARRRWFIVVRLQER